MPKLRRESTDPTACVIYVRVSTEEQASEGVSLAAQEERCRQFAAMRGWPVVRVFIEAGASGTLKDRPELTKLIEFAAHTPVATVVYSLSRLGRSVTHLRELFEELRVASVTESIDFNSPSGRFMATVLAAVSELEVDLIRERTKMGLARVKAEGRRVGRPPIGWRVTAAGTLERDIGGTWSRVEEVFDLHRKHRSNSHIARVFGLHERQVKRILTDERNRVALGE